MNIKCSVQRGLNIPGAWILAVAAWLAGTAPGAAWTVGSTSCDNTNAGEFGLGYVVQEINKGHGTAAIAFSIPGLGPHTIYCDVTVTNRFITLIGSANVVLRGGLEFKAGANASGAAWQGGGLFITGSGRVENCAFAVASASLGAGEVTGCYFSNSILAVAGNGLVRSDNTWAGQNTVNAGGNSLVESVRRAHLNAIGDGTRVYNCELVGANVSGADNVFTGSVVAFAGRVCEFKGAGLQILGNRFCSDQTANVVVRGTNALFQGNLSYSNAAGLQLYGPGHRVWGNWFGLDAGGEHAASNINAGMTVYGASNVIGGVTAAERNIFTGSCGNGLELSQGAGNQVLGNYFGLSATGLVAIGNGQTGLRVHFTGNEAIIGGTNPAARNYVVASGRHGIYSESARALIQNNWIGLRPDGLAAGNGWAWTDSHGLYLDSCADVVVRDNVICSQTNGHGVHGALFCDNLVFAGNRVGTDPAGLVVLPNSEGGVYIASSTNVLIGGDTAADRNVMIGSGTASDTNTDGAAIALWSGYGPQSCRVRGNYIGVDATGARPLGNGLYGILLSGWQEALIGGTNAAWRNVVGASTLAGIKLKDSHNNTVQGNYVGVNGAGTGSVANAVGVLLMDATNNLVGGGWPEMRNIIAGNTGDGLQLRRSKANRIQGNYIGLTANGSNVLGNAIGIYGVGEVLYDTTKNLIGGTNAEWGTYREGNVIAGNRGNGIHLATRAPTNQVQGNIIGADPSARRHGFGNRGHGIYLYGNYNVVGGRQPNIIVGNASNGLHFDTASWSHIYGNFIGVDGINWGGVTNLPNGGHGMALVNAALYNRIGNTRTGTPNVVAGNAGDGIHVGSGCNGNNIRGNWIGVDHGWPRFPINGGAGIRVVESTNNWLGGVAVGEGNAIDGRTGICCERTRTTWVYDNQVGVWGYLETTNLLVGIHVQQGWQDMFGQAGVTNRIGGARLAGVLIENSTNVYFRNALVGCATNAYGQPVTNAGGGIVLTNSTHCEISGNHVAGNAYGIALFNTHSNTLVGNIIGKTTNWYFQPANAGPGVLLVGAEGDVLGGYAVSTYRNVIGGNSSNAVEVWGSVGVTIAGNYIGLDPAGENPVTNAGHGILIDHCAGVIVGGDWNFPNHILANEGDGIRVRGDLGLPPAVIAGNHIGQRTASGIILANGGHGIAIENAAGALIGGTNATYRNTIGWNGGYGILVTGALAQANVLMYNYVGTDFDALAVAPNALGGLAAWNAPANVFGLTNGPNYFSGNFGHGVTLRGAGASNNLVAGNFIGLGQNGNLPLSNAVDGVCVQDAPHNTILANRIDGNVRHGISIVNSGPADLAKYNSVILNTIGFHDQWHAYGNGGSGVWLHDATFNTIGPANSIGGNRENGIEVYDFGAHDNRIVGNLVGQTPTANRMPNTRHGVYLMGGDDNWVGGTNAADANLIAFNGWHGVYVGHGVRNRILGNSIFSNAVKGIQLGTQYVGQAECDGCPNRYQRPPLVTNVMLGSLDISGRIASGSNQLYRVELFLTETTNGPGYGQGKYMLGHTNILTGADGRASFAVSYTSGVAFLAATGWIVTATATDSNGNTSAFSVPFVVGGQAGVPPAAPAGVQARYTEAGQAQVCWAAAAGAETYEIWRNTADSTAGAVSRGYTIDTCFLDALESETATYYYWVSAINAWGPSGISGPGARAQRSTELPWLFLLVE